MKKMMLIVSILFFFLSGINNSFAGDDDLIKLLTTELDITEDQAKGGAGALFNYAKESLDEDEFGQVANAVPNMNGYLDAIPALGGKSTGMLGKVTENVVGMPAVNAAFEKLGLSQDMVGLMTPLLVNYVKTKGGEAVSKLLGKALTK
jgi:hypothetical protein